MNDPPVIDYKSVPPQIPSKTSEERRWYYKRLLFLASLGLLFYLIAFRFGPNLMLFGKLNPLTAADFVPLVQRECVPIVRAIKEYRRDHGKLPDKLDDLVPEYLPHHPDKEHMYGPNQYAIFIGYGELVEYNFSPTDEHWEIVGGFIKETLPIPPVIVGPSTRAATTPK